VLFEVLEGLLVFEVGDVGEVVEEDEGLDAVVVGAALSGPPIKI